MLSFHASSPSLNACARAEAASYETSEVRRALSRASSRCRAIRPSSPSKRSLTSAHRYPAAPAGEHVGEEVACLARWGFGPGSTQGGGRALAVISAVHTVIVSKSAAMSDMPAYSQSMRLFPSLSTRKFGGKKSLCEGRPQKPSVSAKTFQTQDLVAYSEVSGRRSAEGLRGPRSAGLRWRVEGAVQRAGAVQRGPSPWPPRQGG